MSKKNGTLIDLKTFSTKADFPAFCVLETDGRPPGEHLFSLSPRLMSWSEHCWIIDLQPCRSFWQRQAAKAGFGFYALFEKVLSDAFQGEAYRCVFAHHPWPALVYREAMEENTQGVYVLDSLFNQKRYSRVDWPSWFAPLDRLAEHLSRLKIKGFRPAAFRAKEAQMQRFIDRMGFAGPFDLSEAEALAIARRFSGWIGRAWQWTFEKANAKAKSHEQPGLFTAFETADGLRSFPWRPFEWTSPPEITRHLDDPINDWSVIEGFLQEDLNRLCLSPMWRAFSARVTELTWVLTCYNLKTLKIPLHFRHPYDLHADEKTGFQTALSRAHFAWLDVLEDLKQREVDLDLPEEIPLIAWKMRVSGQVFVDPQAVSLLPNPKENPEVARILALQNKLPCPILSYGLSTDFDPLHAFQESEVGAHLEPPHALDPWIAAAQKRPFFYHPQAKAFSPPTQSTPVFLERTACSWWEDEDTQAATKDYFSVENEQGQRVWAWKDRSGTWYQHGIYS